MASRSAEDGDGEQVVNFDSQAGKRLLGDRVPGQRPEELDILEQGAFIEVPRVALADQEGEEGRQDVP